MRDETAHAWGTRLLKAPAIFLLVYGGQD